MDDTGLPVVLVVEDEPDVAETYERWLQSTYQVRTAQSGSAALELLDGTIDVVLLDRMMPEMSGEEVLKEIRDRELDCRVAMVTAVDPDFDIIEMGFDEYISKPPERDELISIVEQLLGRASLDNELQEYYSLVARRSALQTEKTEEELAANDEYGQLNEQIESMRLTIDAELGDMAEDTEFIGAIREIMVEESDPDGQTEVDGDPQ